MHGTNVKKKKVRWNVQTSVRRF